MIIKIRIQNLIFNPDLRKRGWGDHFRTYVYPSGWIGFPHVFLQPISTFLDKYSLMEREMFENQNSICEKVLKIL